jgi:hydrogenase maturation protein HypF
MFKPVAMPGGAAAVREPWRNLYAHLLAAGLRPRERHATLEAMIRNGVNSPLASSCGRLFDAVAAALGICTERQEHEGEAAARLEALVCERTLREGDARAYPFALSSWPVLCRPSTSSPGAQVEDVDGRASPDHDEGAGVVLDPTPMWRALLDDLHGGVPHGVIAARFHLGIAIAQVAMTHTLATRTHFDTVALTGGCFQNAVLLEQTEQRLRAAGFTVLTHSAVPANDGGLALGQAAVAAAQLMT